MGNFENTSSSTPKLLVSSWVGLVASHSDSEISWYVASGEPLDKAGAYAIQALASRFVPRIDGSYTNVVGLPVERLQAELQAWRAAA